MSAISPLILNSPISETIVERLYPNFISLLRRFFWSILSPTFSLKELFSKKMLEGNFSNKTLAGAITISGRFKRVLTCLA